MKFSSEFPGVVSIRAGHVLKSHLFSLDCMINGFIYWKLSWKGSDSVSILFIWQFPNVHVSSALVNFVWIDEKSYQTQESQRLNCNNINRNYFKRFHLAVWKLDLRKKIPSRTVFSFPFSFIHRSPPTCAYENTEKFQHIQTLFSNVERKSPNEFTTVEFQGKPGKRE